MINILFKKRAVTKYGMNILTDESDKTAVLIRENKRCFREYFHQNLV